MRGSIRKRCQCRDDQGRSVTGCRKAHGSWSFKIEVGINPDTGKRKQVGRSGFRTREKAQDAMTKELAALSAGTWTHDEGITVAAWLAQWLEEITERGRSPKTVAGYRSHVRDVWTPQLGHLRLRDLRRGHIEGVLAGLGKPLPGPRPPGNIGSFVQHRTPATLDSYRRSIRAALAVATRRGLISANPAAGRMDAIPDRRNEDELVIWEPEQTAQFLEHVADQRLAALYEVATYAGLRRGELCGLRWADLTDAGTGLLIRQSVVDLSRDHAGPGGLRCLTCGEEHIGRLIKPPKSRAGRRWVPLAPPAQQALATHRARQDEEKARFGADYSDHDLVFSLIDGTPLRPSDVTREFKKHVAACGLPEIRLHDTRHGACSLLLAGGVPVEVVQMILGHTTPDVTRKVYAHLMRANTVAQVQTASELITQHRREQTANKPSESAVP